MDQFPKFLQELNPNVYLSDNYLVLDFETTNKDHGSAIDPENKLVCAVWSYRGKTKRSSTDCESLIKDIKRADFIVAHNAKFELQWLYRSGIEAGSVLVYDTLLAAYCQNGNLKRPLDLGSVAKKYGLGEKHSYVSTLIKGEVCPSEIPLSRLLAYCQQDVELTERVFLLQRQEMLESGLLPVLFTRCLTTLVLADIEANGMWLDKEAVRKEYNEKLELSREVLADLHEITGGINPKSPKQVAEFLYDNLKFEELHDYKGNPIRTETGGRKTGEDVIIALVPKTKEQKAFIDVFRRFIPLKLELATLKKLHECAEAGEPLYAQFNQAITVTHRLSSNGKKYKVQFQNIDRDFKRLFKARHPDWKMGGADGRQLEFRVAIHLGDDEQGKQDVANNADIHKFTAAVVFKKPESKITKSERTEAKASTFRPLFGGSSGTPEIRRYCKAFQTKYKGIFSTQTSWTFDVLKTKKLVTATGLIFYWPDVEMYDSGYIKGTTEIFNYPIQSLATADIIPISLIYMWYRLKIAKALTFIVNTVHDSIASEVAPGEDDLWEDCAKKAFTSDTFEYLSRVYGIKFRTALGVSYNLSSHWDQGVEKEFDLVA